MSAQPIPAPPGAQISADRQWWWDGRQWVPNAPLAQFGAQDHGAAGAPTTEPRSRKADPLTAVLVAFGALLAGIGAFLPWATASAFGLTYSRSGVDGGDGWITVIGAAFGLLLAWAFVEGHRIVLCRVLAIVVVACFAVVGGYDISDVNNRLSGVNDSGLAVGQVGSGLYLTLVAAGLVFLGTLLTFRRMD